jgi:hypothetical protein
MRLSITSDTPALHAIGGRHTRDRSVVTPAPFCCQRAVSRYANGRPTPFAPSTAHTRRGQVLAYARIAA